MRPPSRLLVAARLILGRTQIEVSNDSGVSSRTIYMAENGTAGIASVEKLVRHYAKKGVTFTPPTDGAGWVIHTKHLTHQYDDEHLRASN